MGSAYTTPSFDSFTDMLMLEKEKLNTMGILKSSKSHSIVANHEKGSNKKHMQSNPKPKKDKAQSSSPQLRVSTSSPKEESSKKENLTCAYFKKLGHDEHHCYKKYIDELKHLLDKNKINLPSRMFTSASSSKQAEFDKGKSHTFGTSNGQALCATASHDVGRWLLDSRASHHIASLYYMFFSF